MISVKVNKADRTDLYLQVAADIRRAAGDERIDGDDRGLVVR
jgi:hypothetical protein